MEERALVLDEVFDLAANTLKDEIAHGLGESYKPKAFKDALSLACLQLSYKLTPELREWFLTYGFREVK